MKNIVTTLLTLTLFSFANQASAGWVPEWMGGSPDKMECSGLQYMLDQEMDEEARICEQRTESKQDIELRADLDLIGCSSTSFDKASDLLYEYIDRNKIIDKEIADLAVNTFFTAQRFDHNFAISIYQPTKKEICSGVENFLRGVERRIGELVRDLSSGFLLSEKFKNLTKEDQQEIRDVMRDDVLVRINEVHTKYENTKKCIASQHFRNKRREAGLGETSEQALYELCTRNAEKSKVCDYTKGTRNLYGTLVPSCKKVKLIFKSKQYKNSNIYKNSDMSK
jgi:hypothetical protein